MVGKAIAALTGTVRPKDRVFSKTQSLIFESLSPQSFQKLKTRV
jgi:hypothetical protein